MQNGRTLGVMMLSIVTNLVIFTFFALTLCFIPSLQVFDEFIANKARFDKDLAMFWSA